MTEQSTDGITTERSGEDRSTESEQAETDSYNVSYYYNIDGTWEATQSNGYTVSFVTNQFASPNSFNPVIMGSARLPKGSASASGNLAGLCYEDTIEFTVWWNNGSIGVYVGRFDERGFARGQTYDKRRPSSKASWSSRHPFSKGR
jgi:hypothetical protein